MVSGSCIHSGSSTSAQARTVMRLMCMCRGSAPALRPMLAHGCATLRHLRQHSMSPVQLQATGHVALAARLVHVLCSTR